METRGAKQKRQPRAHNLLSPPPHTHPAAEAAIKPVKTKGEAVAAVSEAGKTKKVKTMTGAEEAAAAAAGAAYDKWASSPPVPKPTKEQWKAAEMASKLAGAGEAAEAGKIKSLKVKGEAVSPISEAGKPKKVKGEAVAAIAEAAKPLKVKGEAVKPLKTKGEAVAAVAEAAKPLKLKGEAVKPIKTKGEAVAAAAEAAVKVHAKKGGEAVAAVSEAGKGKKVKTLSGAEEAAAANVAAAYDKWASSPPVPKPTKEQWKAAEMASKLAGAAEAGESGKKLKLGGEAVEAAMSEAGFGKKAKKGGEAVAAIAEAGKPVKVKGEAAKPLKTKGEAVKPIKALGEAAEAGKKH